MTSAIYKTSRRALNGSALLAALVCAPLCTSAWSLDLSQAYHAAMEQDASLRAARAATAARSERIPQTRAQLLPNLSASASRNRNALESTEPNFLGKPVTTDRNYNSSSAALTLRQPLFRKYQMADYRQAQAQVEDANAILEREVQNVAVRVSGAYFEALLTAEQLALVLTEKTAYTTQLDAAKKRFAAGAGTRTDIDEAQAVLDLNVAQELEARQNVDFTRRQLQTLVNQPVDSLATLDAGKLVLGPPSPNRLEDWTERAEAGSPEIRSLKAQVETARFEVEKAEAGHYPTLDAVAQLSRNESDTVTSVNNRYTNKSIGLQLSVPLFAGGYVNSTIRQALADKERAEQSLEALRRDLGVRVHKEFRGVTEGVLQVRALEQAVRSTGQVVLSNRRSFEAGSRTLNDTLNAEQQAAKARRDLAQARYVYLISRVRLQALAGGPRTEVIDEINAWLMP
ncbi:TolC family outer membrane protein [Polaromonas sp.]|uniref:TolC family outer membrane protein n=1 Tax=Polaromonas sp. TaxID=1869339 RepID=UPI0025EC9169|nr:TolC family outer membrane protein [Polaromonas sp.]